MVMAPPLVAEPPLDATVATAPPCPIVTPFAALIPIAVPSDMTLPALTTVTAWPVTLMAPAPDVMVPMLRLELTSLMVMPPAVLDALIAPPMLLFCSVIATAAAPPLKLAAPVTFRELPKSCTTPAPVAVNVPPVLILPNASWVELPIVTLAPAACTAPLNAFDVCPTATAPVPPRSSESPDTVMPEAVCVMPVAASTFRVLTLMPPSLRLSTSFTLAVVPVTLTEPVPPTSKSLSPSSVTVFPVAVNEAPATVSEPVCEIAPPAVTPSVPFRVSVERATGAAS